MTFSEHFDQQRMQLKLLQGIRQAEDKLVIWIEEALDKKESYENLEESQFRNLVRVADTTESPEVIKNFLRYQVGREKKWGRGRGSLAERIIEDIGAKDKGGKLLNLATTITKNALKKNAEASENKNAENNSNPMEIDSYVQQVWIELIRRYLGYGARYLTYLNKGQSS